VTVAVTAHAAKRTAQSTGVAFDARKHMHAPVLSQVHAPVLSQVHAPVLSHMHASRLSPSALGAAITGVP
jgi:hypothetical protein